jgi:hypothetical protein
MNKDFVTSEQALDLKKLGFDEPCMAQWNDSNGFDGVGGNYINSYFTYPDQIAAPLYQQAFRWFRDKHNLRGFIGFRPNTKQFDYHIYDMSLSGKEYVKQRTMEEFNKDPKVGTYEEAESACLDKLIEIIKNK